jgi:hypothetical protein
MTIYKQIDHIINSIYDTKKIIILILIVVNGLGLIYYKNLKKTYLADIIVTAIPNELRPNAVDVFSIFESNFRNPKNFDDWIKIQKKQNGNKDVLINRNQILGYNIVDDKIITYNNIVFRNAVTLQRSIYLTVPGENSEVLKNIFFYSLHIEGLLNNLIDKDDDEKLDIYKVLNNLKINFNFDLEEANEQKILSNKYYEIINDLFKEVSKINLLDENPIYIKSDDINFVKVSPPQNIYTNSININKIYFSTILLSIFLIFIVLIYKDFRKSTRKSLKLDK